jgi:SAM-dependent methyltransferase
MFNEHNNTFNLYQNNAIDWDRERGRSLSEKPWLDRMLTLLPPKRSILDLGCGSGEPIARYFIDRGCDVTGVDSSSSLVGMCRGRFPGQDWLVADMRTLFLGRRFDGILAWDSFFHLCQVDQRRMFPIFGRHAAPRAALMFTSGPSQGEAIGTYKGDLLYHASLDGDEYQSLLDQNGFDVVSHIVEDPSCGEHTVWLAQRR